MDSLSYATPRFISFCGPKLSAKQQLDAHTAFSCEGPGSFDLTDVYICFPDGSLKRPDISVFCERPSITQAAITVVPGAVVEIVSPRRELKDPEVGPPFYLSERVNDVIVCDLRTLMGLHFRCDGVTRHVSPVVLTLTCGCALTALLNVRQIKRRH